MALKLNCLLTDTNLRDDIKTYINDKVSARIADNQVSKVGQLFEEVRKEGIEIDAESFANMYNELYNGVQDSRLSNTDEIIEFSDLDFKQITQTIGNSAKGKAPENTESEIGRLSPVKQAIRNVMSLFDSNNYPQGSESKSVMKNISDTLNKLVNDKLAKNKTEKSDVYDSISNFFDLENIQNYPKKSGGFNTIETAFADLKTELNNVVNNITLKEKLDATQEQLLREKYDKYINELQSSVYDIILSKGEQAELLRNLLNQNGLLIDGKGVKNFNNDINWDKLTGEFGEPKLISAKIKEMLMDGVTNNEGNIVKYEEPYAQRIADYFERLYEAKRESVIQAKANAITDKTTVDSILSNFVKSKGFVTLGKDQDDKLTRVISNWDRIVKSLKKNTNSIADIKAELKAILETKYDLSEGQIELVLKQLEETLIQKMQGKSKKANAIDKLIALSQLNGGISFDRSTATALMDILEVDDLTQDNINLIKQGVEAANRIQSNQPFSPINGTAISLIQRNAKQIVINEIKKNHPLQRVVRVFVGYMNAVLQSILQNGFNFVQNITSGIVTNIAESASMFSKYGTNALPTWGKAQKAFWNGFISQILGGVEQTTQDESVLGNELMTGEQYRMREWLNLFKKGGIGNIAEGVATTPVMIINTISRVFLNSLDSGLMASQIAKGTLLETYTLLESQGHTKSEINKVISDYNSNLKNVDYKKQISDEVNKQVGLLNKAGIRVNIGDKFLIKRNIEFSLIADSLIGEGSIDKANVKDTVKTLFDNAVTTAMVLHGKKQIPSNSIVASTSNFPYFAANAATSLQKKAFESSEKSKKAGNYNKAAVQYLGGAIAASSIGTFANGMANFFVLSQTWNPLGLLHGFGAVRSRKNYEKEHPELLKQDINKVDQEILAKNLQFKRMQTALFNRVVFGSLAIGTYILSNVFDEDDDDDEKGWWDETINNLMATKSGRKLVAYVLPMAISAYEYATYNGKDESANKGAGGNYKVGKGLADWAGYVVVGARDGGVSKFFTGVARAKEEELDEPINKALIEFMPTSSTNYRDKVKEFSSTVGSGFTGNTSDVVDNEKVKRDIYTKEYETLVENYFKTGVIKDVKDLSTESLYK